MRTFFALAVVYLSAFPALAQSHATAQTAPPMATQESNRAKEADIRRLLELTHVRKLLGQMLTNSVEQLKPQLAAAVPQDSRGQKFVEIFFLKFQARLRVDDLFNQMVAIYGKYFNADEIQGLIQFYQTPLGQRAVEVLPQIAIESRTFSGQLGQEIALRVLREMRGDYPEITQMLEPPPPGKP